MPSEVGDEGVLVRPISPSPLGSSKGCRMIIECIVCLRSRDEVHLFLYC